MIEDNGPGLDVEERESFFERFYTGANGVTGLGLAICRQIAARLNGELTYSRSELGGARFSFFGRRLGKFNLRFPFAQSRLIGNL
ncbi:ATP-binding protein [Paenibacillus rhizoplanae]